MKVLLTKPTHVYVQPCEIEVTKEEAHRLFMLGACELVEEKEVKVEEKKTKRVAK